ncbi:MAG TPA: DUF1700 domain-containing protein [Rhizomicrobium sp.]|nr:DUF1700 domain-containing protein [Rhizomicrobium sp.]
MKRADFMAQLRAGLSGLHSADVDEILADYETHFADGAAHGRSEDEVSAALGDPARLAREMRAEVGFRRWENDRSAGNLVGVVLALLGLATLDLMFLLPALFVMFFVFVGLACACVGVIIGGSFLLISTLVGNYHEMSPVMQGFLGLGLVSGGVGGGALLILVTNWVARTLIRYARLHFRLFDTATQSI